jgi:hypothetical protein
MEIKKKKKKKIVRCRLERSGPEERGDFTYHERRWLISHQIVRCQRTKDGLIEQHQSAMWGWPGDSSALAAYYWTPGGECSGQAAFRFCDANSPQL